MKNTSVSALTAAVILVTMLTASAVAQPILTVNNPQSYANYQLNTTIRTFQDCSATPSEYSGIACGSPSFPGGAFITIRDDGQCVPSGDQNCQFSPNNVTINVGGFVQWQNVGSLNHTVTSDSLSFPLDLLLRPNSTNGTTFSASGTFKYHDKLHSWITGTVVIVSPVAPPSKTRLFNVTGPVGWTLVGLNSETAILTVSHQLKVYNATSSPQKLLFSESGLIEDLIDLRTRVESVGITNLILNTPYLYQYIYGYGYGYGYGYWGPYSPYPQTNGPPSNQVVIYPPPGPGIYPYYPPKTYTAWWVNGSLSLGSIVEVQYLVGSVRGSESLSLGGDLGTRDAWMVESQYKQQFSQPPPQIPTGSTSPQYFTSNQSIATLQQYDYGKQSNLLFKYSDNIDQYSQSNLVCPAGAYFYNGYCNGGFTIFQTGFPPFPGQVFTVGAALDQTVTVTRTQSTSLSLTLSLLSTNVNLEKNANPSSPATTTPNSTNPLQAALMPVLYTATGIAASALVGAAIWLVLRSRKKSQIIDTVPAPTALPEPAQPA